MRGRSWMWALLVGGAVLVAGAAAAADEMEQPAVMRVELEEGRAPDGRVVALRVRTEGGGLGTCGEANGVEFSNAGEGVASRTQPVAFEIEGLDCEVVVSWGESGPWMIQVRGGKVQAKRPTSAPAEPQEPGVEAEARDRS
ncbi:MAG: hypothetical protein ACREKH_01960 [Candidatus Rokuibacteriota bacterium]